MDFGSIIGILIVVLVILFVIFMLMRELMCWYWKINEVVSLLKSIDNKLSRNSSNSVFDQTGTSSSIPVGSTNYKKCSQCSKLYEASFTGEFCDQCGAKL